MTMLSTRERRWVCRIRFSNSKCHIQNTCAINGNKPHMSTSLFIFNFDVRKLLRNQPMNSIEHGVNLGICMAKYVISLYIEFNFIHGNAFFLPP